MAGIAFAIIDKGIAGRLNDQEIVPMKKLKDRLKQNEKLRAKADAAAAEGGSESAEAKPAAGPAEHTEMLKRHNIASHRPEKKQGFKQAQNTTANLPVGRMKKSPG